MNKKMISLIVLALFIVLSAPAIAANDDIKVYVNGSLISFPDQKPFINADNRTLVPVRFVSEALGAKVDWLALTKTVEIDYEDKTILIEIGLKQALVGLDVITLDTGAEIVNSRTMVPLRFVSECLGAEVEWNGQKREIYISTKMPPANPFVGQLFKPSDLPTKDGYPIFGSDRPGAQIMYADIDQLPVKVGRYIIYSVYVDNQNINITQHSDETYPEPIDIYMIEDCKITIGRAPDYVQKGKLFTYTYPIKSTLDITPVDISKVSNIALFTYEKMEFRMLVLPNPAYNS